MLPSVGGCWTDCVRSSRGLSILAFVLCIPLSTMCRTSSAEILCGCHVDIVLLIFTHARGSGTFRFIRSQSFYWEKHNCLLQPPHGFCCHVACAPCVTPSGWLPLVLPVEDNSRGLHILCSLLPTILPPYLQACLHSPLFCPVFFPFTRWVCHPATKCPATRSEEMSWAAETGTLLYRCFLKKIPRNVVGYFSDLPCFFGPNFS